MLAFAPSRKRILVAGFVFAALGILAAHPTLARSFGADVWNLPALKAELQSAADVDAELDGEAEEIRRRIKVKEAIIAELLGGRITLAEATERFSVLNASRPNYVALIRAQFPGQTDQESVARNVICYAILRLPPHERDAANSRFEAELQRMLAGSASH